MSQVDIVLIMDQQKVSEIIKAEMYQMYEITDESS